MEVTKPKVEIISHTGIPYDVVSVAAKTCYSSMDLDDLMRKFTDAERLKLIKSLEDSKHESPFEHVSITFAISNISRACSHQLVRHRIASFSQRSQRYVDETGFNYFVPEGIRNNETINNYYTDIMDELGHNYDTLKVFLINSYISELSKGPEGQLLFGTVTSEEPPLKYLKALQENEKFKEYYPVEYRKIEKKAGEDARYILPNACITQIVMTMNIRSLWNFFNLRCCNRAQAEINELAWEMLRQCKKRWPLLFEHAGPDCMNGICKEKPGFSCGRPPFEKMVEIRNYSHAIDDSDYDDSSEWLKGNPNVKKE